MNKSEQVRQLLAQHVPSSEIVKIVGCSRQLVSLIHFKTLPSSIIRVTPPPDVAQTIHQRANGYCELFLTHPPDMPSRWFHLKFITLQPMENFDNVFLACSECIKLMTSFARNKIMLKTRPCISCGKDFNYKTGSASTKRCFACSRQRREDRAKLWSPRFNLTACLSCHRSDRPCRKAGLCTSCVARANYRNDPDKRARVKATNKKWQVANRERYLTTMRAYAARRQAERIAEEQSLSTPTPLDKT